MTSRPSPGARTDGADLGDVSRVAGAAPTLHSRAPLPVEYGLRVDNEWGDGASTRPFPPSPSAQPLDISKPTPAYTGFPGHGRVHGKEPDDGRGWFRLVQSWVTRPDRVRRRRAPGPARRQLHKTMLAQLQQWTMLVELAAAPGLSPRQPEPRTGRDWRSRSAIAASLVRKGKYGARHTAPPGPLKRPLLLVADSVKNDRPPGYGDTGQSPARNPPEKPRRAPPGSASPHRSGGKPGAGLFHRTTSSSEMLTPIVSSRSGLRPSVRAGSAAVADHANLRAALDCRLAERNGLSVLELAGAL